MTSATYIMVITQDHFAIYNPVKVFFTHSCNDRMKSKWCITVLLACNVDDSDEILPSVTAKYRSTHCYNHVKNMPKKHDANKLDGAQRATKLIQL